MVDDGSRLTFSIGQNAFNITDALTGKTVIFKDGYCTTFTIDREVVLQKIKTLQEALSTYTLKYASVLRKSTSLSYNDKLIIREDKHFQWTIGYNGKGATLCDNTFTRSHGFDTTLVLRRLSSVYTQILNYGLVRDPKHDIVRRVSDVGLLVWVYGGHSVAVYEKNVNGCCMANCLIDGNYYDIVLVGTSVESCEATLFTKNLNEIVTFPLDESILAYYPDGDKIYSTQE